MNNKNKTGLTRSENGTRYFAMKREASKPISDLFNQQMESDHDKILRHLDLGSITLHFYNKVTKKEVTEIDITTPFVLNAKCYDTTTGQFKRNNNVSKIIRSHLPDNYEQNINALSAICNANGLEDEFRFFEEQFSKYKKRDDSWYFTADEPDTGLAPYVEFFTSMEKRYKSRTGKKFNLNPYALTYLQLLLVQDYSSSIPIPSRTTITVDDLKNSLQRHTTKLHIKPIPKPSKLRNLFKSLFKWNGLEVDPDKLDIDTFEEAFGDGPEDSSYRLNYEILPKIHADYSRLAEINLETISCELWVELFKLNNGIPPFLVPDDTIDEFTDEQLKEIVKYAPRIILEWDKPELFNLDVKLPITEVYPVLSHKQKCDQLTLVHLGFENRHLIPESLKCISSLDKAVESSTANLSEIYHLLSEDLRLKHWKGIVHKYNLEFIPDHKIVASEFERLVVMILFEHASHTDCPRIQFEKLHPILQRDPEKLFTTIVHLCEIGFDPERTIEPHTYWRHGIEQITIEGYDDVENRLSPDLQKTIEDCGMREGCVIHINPKLAAEFRKALHYHKLQAKIPMKIDVPKKKNKI